ncbi:efflux RND transporter periplasmic adaptor subunit [Azospirillum halopraeferens]|uniref:efflux RND transporter periplasmic adaptor subunit n=1 Tax=Azospirillum halopraeferens TaxID=34010 RepID=UPI0004050AFF|nr:efflux RND transporter periplasmic adaptor subunit [Azospirillum halopraeferens]
MNRSVVIAGLVTVAAVAWVLSGQIRPAAVPAAPEPEGAAPAPEEPAARAVRVARLAARPMTDTVVLQGRTEASRSVELRAEVRGRVEAVPVPRGAAVTQGDVLVRLAVNDREAQLDQARALLEQRRIEHRAARSLNTRGHNTDIQLAQAAAALEAAQAAVRKAEVDLANTVIRAPFDGVLDRRPVELGDFLDTGNPVATVVDLDPVRVVGFASERQVGNLRAGGSGTARIIGGAGGGGAGGGGSDAEGTIAYVAAVADPATRTFRVELEVPNPDRRIVAGLTAQLRLPVGERPGHFVSPSVLSLADDGTIGVKVVDGDRRVRFLPVQILATEPDGVWLAGLPHDIVLITVGHEFVAAGNPVVPVEGAGGGAT